jgi:hypothetical protein
VSSLLNTGPVTFVLHQLVSMNIQGKLKKLFSCFFVLLILFSFQLQTLLPAVLEIAGNGEVNHVFHQGGLGGGLGFLAGFGGFGFLGPFGLGGFGAFLGVGGGCGFCNSTPAEFTGPGPVIAGAAATEIRKAIARIIVFICMSFIMRCSTQR